MLDSTSVAAILVAVISLFGTFITAYLSHGKFSKADAVEYESRLTTLEQNQFSSADRRCLHDIDTKMRTIWKFFERDLPAALTQRHTPRLDELLEKAKEGLGKMRVSEAKELFSLVKAEEAESMKNEEKAPGTRRLKLSMYRGFLEHELAALKYIP